MRWYCRTQATMTRASGDRQSTPSPTLGCLSPPRDSQKPPWRSHLALALVGMGLPTLALGCPMGRDSCLGAHRSRPVRDNHPRPVCVVLLPAGVQFHVGTHWAVGHVVVPVGSSREIECCRRGHRRHRVSEAPNTSSRLSTSVRTSPSGTVV